MTDIFVKKIRKREAQVSTFYDKFNIEDINEKLNGRPMKEKLHRHDFFYILALDKGIGSHFIDFKSYEVKDYVLYFIKPGQVHKINLSHHSNGFMLTFYKNLGYPYGIYFQQLLSKVRNKNFYEFSKKEYERINNLLSIIFIEYRHKKEGYIDIIQANLCSLIIQLIRKNSSNNLDNLLTYKNERLNEFLELVDLNIQKIKRVSEYSKMMNLSQYQLNSVTKEMLNKTPSQIINETLILEIKRNLLATTSQISEIAFKMGFVDQSYFIRFFKKQTGYTPLLFRKKMSKSTI